MILAWNESTLLLLEEIRDPSNDVRLNIIKDCSAFRNDSDEV
jgi:hypothetical protein